MKHKILVIFKMTRKSETEWLKYFEAKLKQGKLQPTLQTISDPFK